MNIYICGDMKEHLENKPKPKQSIEFVTYLEDEIQKYIKKNHQIIFSLLSLFLIQESWIKNHTNYENTYYVFDLEKDKYKTLYYCIKDIHSDFKNPKRLNNNIRYITGIIPLSQDRYISDKIKKEAYTSLYDDLHHNLRIDGVQITDKETIQKEIQKGTSLDQIMIELKP